MHICVVSPGYPTLKTIDFVFVDQLCRFFAKKGNKVTIIAPQSLTKSLFRHIPIVPKFSTINISNEIHINLIRPYHITLGNSVHFKHFNMQSFNKAVIRAFKSIDEKPDVCYGHFWKAVYSIYPVARNLNIPLIASSGEELITLQEDYSVEKITEFAKYIKGVISVSTKNKGEIIKAGLSSDDRCKVILNAIDPTLFCKKDKLESRKRFGFNEKDFIVAFVGQFTVRKGSKRLSDALTFLNDNSIKALFLGTGSEIPDYKNIIFQGTVPHDFLPGYMNCADIFVLPTLNEGCCNAIIEAMACGLPIISSDLPFNYDILNKNNSILINPCDIKAIADAVSYLKENPEKCNQMSINAIKTTEDLTLTKRAENIIAYIQTLI